MVPPDPVSFKAEMESLRDFIVANVTQLQRRVSILERRVDDAEGASPVPRESHGAADGATEPAAEPTIAIVTPSSRRWSGPLVPRPMTTRSSSVGDGGGGSGGGGGGEAGKGKEPMARYATRSRHWDGRKVGECHSVAMEISAEDSPDDRRNNIALILKESDSNR